jgi:hypothetical protein
MRSAEARHRAALAAAVALSAALSPLARAEEGVAAPRHAAAVGAAPRAASALDEDGVLMLYPTGPGKGFRLGGRDPAAAEGFAIEKSVRAEARSEGGFAYWRVESYPLDYASGGSGLTCRLHMYASGAAQAFTWRTQKGFLSDPEAPRDQELTVFLRVRGRAVPKRSVVALKIRGGRHGAGRPDQASCVMMDLESADSGHPARFGKELDHPLYDYVALEPRFDAALVEDAWIGLKLVSYSDTSDRSRVVNRLYLDLDPVGPGGSVGNDWRLFSEYVDVEGKKTGRYSKLVDWSGWQSTVRIDGYREVDFALPSLRPIVAPREPGEG